MNRAGFSLIELLVAIAIIAILASVATPAVTSAIERSQAVKCAGNLRAIGVAVQQYIAENDYRFPPIETDPPTLENNGKTALETLSPYGISMAELTCPSDKVNVKKFGSSYHFNPVVQDELASSVNIYGRRGIFQLPNVTRLTICSDYEPVHAGPGRLGMNVLKADGRVIQR
jgi:prepilin-type N-terminal cleavage/methylation domain-containing protein